MFCGNCGSPVSETAKFCPNCGIKRLVRTSPRCPACGAEVKANDKFCQECGTVLAQKSTPVQQSVQQPQAMPAYNVPANVVPRTKTGKRVIYTNRPFTHEELLQFMTERWDVANYNYIITDPSLKKWTDLYVLLPATARHMIIVYSRDAGSMFSKENKIVVSFIPNPGGAAELMIRAIPTNNAFFGAAKIAGNMNEKQDREGPTDDAMQRYADYLHFLLQQAGYLQG